MKTVVLKTFDNNFHANLLLARLQNEGINCYLKGEDAVNIDPLIRDAIQLLVYEDDFAAAGELLKTIHEEQLRDAMCPVCGKNAITEMEPKKSRNIFSDFMSRYVLFSTDRYYLCKSCGFRSNAMPDLQANNDIGNEWES